MTAVMASDILAGRRRAPAEYQQLVDVLVPERDRMPLADFMAEARDSLNSEAARRAKALIDAGSPGPAVAELAKQAELAFHTGDVMAAVASGMRGGAKFGIRGENAARRACNALKFGRASVGGLEEAEQGLGLGLTGLAEASLAAPEDFVGPPTKETWEKWNENAAERRARYNRIIGIGEAKRMELAAAFELVRREYASKTDDERGLDVKSLENRCRVFRRVLRPDDRQERFALLVLDSGLHPLADLIVVSVGTLDGTMVHPREVFQPALRWGAHAIMVAHNHPSGDLEPSEKDLILMRRLVEASRVVAVPLLDHLVLGAVDSAGGTGCISIRAGHPELFA